MAEEKESVSWRRKTAKELLGAAEKGQRTDFFTEKQEIKKKEVSPEEEIIRQEIRREIDLMNLDEKLKKEAEQKANKISYLGEEEKIEHLMKLAKERGVVFSLKVAKNMNDPFVLDIFHDTLIREGLWKNFEK